MKCLRIWLMLTSGFFSMTLTGQNFNRPIPVGYVYPYNFIQYDSTFYGDYLMAPFKLNSPLQDCRQNLLLLDKDGYISWYAANSGRYHNFQYHPNIHKFSCYYHKTTGTEQIILLDSTLNVMRYIDRIEYLPIDMHEFQILRNGNAVFFSLKDSLLDLSKYTFDGVKGFDSSYVRGAVIFEIDTANNVVFRWYDVNHFDFNLAANERKYDRRKWDYSHANAISEDFDGNFLVTFWTLNSVYKIDRRTGRVIWRLGGKGSSFTFPNDIGFTMAHDFRYLPDGTYSLYDNTDSTVQKTRAVMYSLDTVKWTATKIWEYKPNPSFFTPVRGNHQVTDDMNHLVNYGRTTYNKQNGPFPNIDFVHHNGEKISQIFFTDSVESYKSYIYKLPFSFPQPQIKSIINKDSVTLQAPKGYLKYVWSTGETTDHITITNTGVYQVWVNYGIGMLGSKPFFYKQSKKL